MFNFKKFLITVSFFSVSFSCLSFDCVACGPENYFRIGISYVKNKLRQCFSGSTVTPNDEIIFPAENNQIGDNNKVINIVEKNHTNTTNNYNVSFNNNPEDLKKIIEELTKKNNNKN